MKTMLKTPLKITLKTQMKSIIAALALFMLGAGSAAAEWQPDGPIRLLIGFGAGGSTDTIGRIIAKRVQQNTNWKVIAENKPGAGGVAMSRQLARAKPDGRTIGMAVTEAIAINLALRGDELNFTVDSFDYLGTVGVAAVGLLAAADAPFDDIAGMIAHANKTGNLTVGFNGKGPELITRALANVSGAPIRPLPTKSGGEVIQNLLGGHIDAGYAAGPQVKYIANGDLKLIAPLTRDRHAYSPGTATLAEQGFDFAIEPYFYLAAPKGLPRKVRAALVREIGKVIGSAEVAEVIRNSMNTSIKNLGPKGTLAQMKRSLRSNDALLQAAK
ncbi:MAG: tripartite tricarboxylate transporter substrate binding protein [Gammaproteobacteria bacterium]